MMPKLANRARMTTATTGTGTITLGAATSGYQSFAAAGVVNADQVRYVIEDGTAWEIGTGTYTAAGTTLSRSPEASSAGGGALTLTGSAVVFITATAADIARPADVQVYTTPGVTTWVKPAGARTVEVYLIGGGGGGGSGRKTAVATAASGGGGGGGGGMSLAIFDAQVLPDTVTVTVAEGGAGGAAQTVNSTNGLLGTHGGNTTFGALLIGAAGARGAIGGTAASVGGAGGAGSFSGGAGGGCPISGLTGGSAAAFAGPTGGGSGGLLVASGAATEGGFTRTPHTRPGDAADRGAVGQAKAPSPPAPPANTFIAGAGGGGGASSTTGNGGEGGDAVWNGGGGGGGGAARDDLGNSGAGGNGGSGLAIVITHFN